MTAPGPLRAHVARALSAHLSWCKRQGIAEPPELRALLDVFVVLDRQEPTMLAPLETDPHGRLMDRREAAARLRVSTRTVDRLIASGAIATVAVGRRRLIAPAAIEAILDQDRSA